jgi:hypothetical protein
MFTFPIPGVRKVIERGKADAAANGGFRNPYDGLKPGKGEIPGLWLVGDQGVCIMSNGKLGHRDRPLVVCSDECHPVGNQLTETDVSLSLITRYPLHIPSPAFRAADTAVRGKRARQESKEIFHVPRRPLHSRPVRKHGAVLGPRRRGNGLFGVLRR